MNLEESIKIVDKTFEQIRRISANLRPAILDDLGLVAALRWLVNSMAKMSNIDTLFILMKI
jgi:signal transduction histidine kinase